MLTSLVIPGVSLSTRPIGNYQAPDNNSKLNVILALMLLYDKNRIGSVFLEKFDHNQVMINALQIIHDILLTLF
jgi:hypothetical protein